MSEDNTTLNENHPIAPKKYYDYISVGNRTKQSAYFVQQHDKAKMLVELLKPLHKKQILLIVKSKKSADKLQTILKEKELNVLSVHGNHRTSQIEDAQNAFNAKELQILITTYRIFETMELTDVQTLIYHDLPFEAPDYFKALRTVDEVGEAISLIDPQDEGQLETIQLMMKCEMQEEELEGFEHTNSTKTQVKDKSKKPRHKKVAQRAKRKAEIKSKWVPVDKQDNLDIPNETQKNEANEENIAKEN
ncbi:DEAD/DEAH box helicase [Sulfurimonas sp. SAG-AH-194-L11]|nr:DEAD/DEAH box helicase [Sulfurimonas sp. SAG-AH-194-L11]MDF1877138.1 DEAD/DEAH box helicase [Sulfurimonas sp. SAG-AH-194-L11]